MSNKSIKYLFKYIHKGNDRVTATVSNGDNANQSTQVVDEICNYYDCRYISACEATWRIFGFEIQMKEPVIVRVTFHLEHEQPVIYKDSASIQDVVNKAADRKMMFLGWMEANRTFGFARSLTYPEFPTKFVWKEDCSKWMPRKQGFAIGRLTHVPAGSGEDYYLKLLLNIQKGCMSYSDIRTVEVKTYDSFKDACFALGLL